MCDRGSIHSNRQLHIRPVNRNFHIFTRHVVVHLLSQYFFIRSPRALTGIFNVVQSVHISKTQPPHRQLNRSQSNLHIFFLQEIKLYACYLFFSLISGKTGIFNVVQLRVHILYPQLFIIINFLCTVKIYHIFHQQKCYQIISDIIDINFL